MHDDDKLEWNTPEREPCPECERLKRQESKSSEVLESFRRSWQQAQRGETLSLAELWDDYDKQALYTTLIINVGLSVVEYNALVRSGVRSVADVAAMTEDDLRRLRNVGIKRAASIRRKVDAFLEGHS